MANQVVRYVITADAQQATRELGRGADAAEGVNKKLGALAAGAALYLGAQALGAVKAFVGDSVRAFSDLEQSVGGTEAVFGDAGRIIDEFASKSATSMGLSEAEFRTATTSIGGQLKRMTGDVEFAAERSVFLTGVAADLAATYGGTTAEAVQALGAAFRGEADPAERFNLNLKASVVNAKAVEMGLAASTTQVDENARAMAILELITEQSADAQGQFARESDTVAGQAQITAAQLENQKAIVGETLQAYKDWGNFLQLTMGKALGNLALDIQRVTGAITDGEAALRSYELASGKPVNSLEDLNNTFRDLNERVENFSFWSWENILDDPRGDLQGLQQDIVGVVDALDLSIEDLKQLQEDLPIVTELWGLDEQAASDLASFLDTELHNAQVIAMEDSRRRGSEHNRVAREVDEATQREIEALERWKGQLQSAAEKHEEFTEQILEQTDEIVTGFHELTDENQISLEEWAANRAKAAQDYEAWLENLNTLQAAGFGTLVEDARQAGFDSSRGMVQEAVDTLNGPDGFAVLEGIVGAAGEDIGALLAAGMALGIDKNAPNIIEAARAAVRRAENAARNEARIESPSKLFAEKIGRPIAEGIALGIEQGSSSIERAVRGAVDGSVKVPSFRTPLEAYQAASQGAFGTFTRSGDSFFIRGLADEILEFSGLQDLKGAIEAFTGTPYESLTRDLYRTLTSPPPAPTPPPIAPRPQPSINITVNALDPQGAARAVKEALDQWIRTNGFPRGWMQ